MLDRRYIVPCPITFAERTFDDLLSTLRVDPEAALASILCIREYSTGCLEALTAGVAGLSRVTPRTKELIFEAFLRITGFEHSFREILVRNGFFERHADALENADSRMNTAQYPAIEPENCIVRLAANHAREGRLANERVDILAYLIMVSNEKVYAEYRNEHTIYYIINYIYMTERKQPVDDELLRWAAYGQPCTSSILYFECHDFFINELKYSKNAELIRQVVRDTKSHRLLHMKLELLLKHERSRSCCKCLDGMPAEEPSACGSGGTAQSQPRAAYNKAGRSVASNRTALCTSFLKSAVQSIVQRMQALLSSKIAASSNSNANERVLNEENNCDSCSDCVENECSAHPKHAGDDLDGCSDHAKDSHNSSSGSSSPGKQSVSAQCDGDAPKTHFDKKNDLGNLIIESFQEGESQYTELILMRIGSEELAKCLIQETGAAMPVFFRLCHRIDSAYAEALMHTLVFFDNISDADLAALAGSSFFYYTTRGFKAFKIIVDEMIKRGIPVPVAKIFTPPSSKKAVAALKKISGSLRNENFMEFHKMEYLIDNGIRIDGKTFIAHLKKKNTAIAMQIFLKIADSKIIPRVFAYAGPLFIEEMRKQTVYSLFYIDCVNYLIRKGIDISQFRIRDDFTVYGMVLKRCIVGFYYDAGSSAGGAGDIAGADKASENDNAGGSNDINGKGCVKDEINNKKESGSSSKGKDRPEDLIYRIKAIAEASKVLNSPQPSPALEVKKDRSENSMQWPSTPQVSECGFDQTARILSLGSLCHQKAYNPRLLSIYDRIEDGLFFRKGRLEIVNNDHKFTLIGRFSIEYSEEENVLLSLGDHRLLIKQGVVFLQSTLPAPAMAPLTDGRRSALCSRKNEFAGIDIRCVYNGCRLCVAIDDGPESSHPARGMQRIMISESFDGFLNGLIFYQSSMEFKSARCRCDLEYYRSVVLPLQKQLRNKRCAGVLVRGRRPYALSGSICVRLENVLEYRKAEEIVQ